MSNKKRKGGPTLGIQELYDSITGIKPKLSADKTNDASLISDLHTLANLAESFVEHRQKPNKGWLLLADELDREGVNLWNMSSAILRQGKDQEGRKLFAALRLAAFRLVEAGLEQKPGIQNIGSYDLAGAVLSAAAKIEELLINTPPDDVHTQSRDRALIVYYTCRMEAREQLASKILEIGKGIARGQPFQKGKSSSNVVPDGKHAQDAIKWIQKALSLVENMATSEAPGILELKVGKFPRLLKARVYYLASSVDEENLDRAEATLRELITSIDDTPDIVDFQPVRWMHLAVLRRKKASDNVLFEAQNVVGVLTTTTIFLQELRGMAQQQMLVTQIHQHLLETALVIPEDTGRVAVDKMMLALIFHCSRDTDHGRAIKAVRDACSCVTERGDYELPKVPTTACQSLLWQFGERHYSAKAWDKAADWFLLGTHDVFKSMAQNNNAKCLRKAALCYIQLREYARATAAIRRCRNNEAATHYITFLIAINQGLETEGDISAIRAIQDVVQAKDFDRRMLLLATQLAHDAGLKAVLLAVLDSLLQFLRSQDGFESDIEALTIIRKTLVQALIGHFKTGNDVCDTAQEKKNLPAIVKELSWLWRTAYNIAVQGCSEWTDSEEQLAELFDLSRAFMDLYRKASVTTGPDNLVHDHIILASFSSISCRVFAVRRLGANVEQEETRKRICRDIDAFKNSVKLAANNAQLHDTFEEDRVGSMIHVSLVFETEQRCYLKDWEGVLTSIEEASQLLKVKASTFEAMADILWVDKDCPVDVLYSALEAILHACLDRDYLSVEKFSRWLRAICTILLAKNTTANRTKAIGYVEQGVSVIEENSKNQGSDVQKTHPII
ncbi:hypothetical protein Clacol_008095 [Clathrus columnatus]|uniref:Protein ZIP4 homolog n=1 Tax=Clathrus columnatus TaxID=1419009 RepID=A0AAV5AL71_9AGAM|nr:hypothetical protein Clacol_008095 [Clathrus columnatus]